VQRRRVCNHEAPAASIGPERSIETAGSGYKRQRIALDVIALMLVARETAANRSVAAVPTGMCTRNLLGRMFD
jgi:hypothetical protein